ncbi:MAG: hypothetical protein IKJ77_09295 [Firmicutes bacterium]|nr:hypothetical protein [Bacillota bacterium]
MEKVRESNMLRICAILIAMAVAITSVAVTVDDIYAASAPAKDYRSADGGKTYKFIIKTKKLSYTTIKKQDAKKYFYKVRALKKVNGKNQYGSYSNIVTATTNK